MPTCLLYTNSDPKIITQYFIDEVSSRNGTAALSHSDFETENCYIKQMQMFLRHDHLDNFSHKCYLYSYINNREVVGHFKEARHSSG